MNNNKSTREQIKELKLIHPQWTNVELARAVKPPVTPQRIGSILRNKKREFKNDVYRAYNRHRYHKNHKQKIMRKNCKYCKGVQFAS